MNNDIAKLLEQYNNKLIFLPLGGVGEIGLNCYLYHHKGKWLMVDLGIGFADDSIPGIDILLPSIDFIEPFAKDLLGIVITHAHEDHVGAISHLWSKLRCPLYMSEFAKEMLSSRLDEAGLLGRVEINTISPDTTISISPFEISFVAMNHSIPEAHTLMIKAGETKVIHTGDWKFDNNKDIELKPNYETFENFGKSGITAVIGDSTSVFTEGFSKSEMTVRETLIDLFAKYNKGILVGCFASNIARLESIAIAAAKNNRKVCLVGRSLWRADGAARASGYLIDIDDFLSEQEAAEYDKSELVYVCTGSQGERRSAMHSIAKNDNRFVRVGKGDVVIFSARVIPGNETEVSLVQNRLSILGAEVISNTDIPEIHVSGHPARGDMAKMYELVKPKYVIPVHGEPVHLEEHAKFALECGCEKSLEIKDGDMVLISNEDVKTLSSIETGILAIDGKRIIRMDSSVLKSRKKIIYSGSIVATIVINKDAELLGEPQISSIGLYDEESEEITVIKEKVKEVIGGLQGLERNNDFTIKEQVKMAIRKYVAQVQGNKPLTEVHLVRI